MSRKILVTGAAGFIGFHLSRRLLNNGIPILGLDNLNDYYDMELKEARLDRLRECEGFEFVQLDVQDRESILRLLNESVITHVVHLTAQAGVRYSLENPHTYVDSNLVGFLNVLEGCRFAGVEHLVFASSSSVYGANEEQPYSVQDNVDHPLSLYAATKKGNELMAHAYANLHSPPTTGLRFFTVYGPWGRPDMALFLFTKAILEGQPIDVYNHGDMQRDFTYVDDMVEGIVYVLRRPPDPDPQWSGEKPDPSSSFAPYRIYNIGRGEPVQLMDFIKQLENVLGKEAQKNFLPMQPGDVPSTYADIQRLSEATGYRPETSLSEGIQSFVEWYKKYYA